MTISCLLFFLKPLEFLTLFYFQLASYFTEKIKPIWRRLSQKPTSTSTHLSVSVLIYSLSLLFKGWTTSVLRPTFHYIFIISALILTMQPAFSSIISFIYFMDHYKKKPSFFKKKVSSWYTSVPAVLLLLIPFNHLYHSTRAACSCQVFFYIIIPMSLSLFLDHQ